MAALIIYCSLCENFPFEGTHERRVFHFHLDGGEGEGDRGAHTGRENQIKQVQEANYDRRHYSPRMPRI